MSAPVQVALLGFSNFERTTLSACFRLASVRQPHYAQVTDLEQAELVVADADHAASVQLVQVTERLADTVFIGAHPPEDARAWMARPIDPVHLMRELDAMVAQRTGEHMPGGREPRAAPPSAAPVASISSALPVSPAPALAPVSAPATQAAQVAQAIPVHPAARLEPAPPPPSHAQPAMTSVAAPIAAPSGPAPAPRRSRRPSPAARPLRHALLVDDSAIATLFLQKCLQPFGLEIATAASSPRATLLMSQQRFDLVFLDVELGDDSPMDGLALCQQIRRHPVPPGEQPPVVVMVSAHHRELDRVRGTLAGCDAYLAKPLDQAVLERLLRRHGLEPQPSPAPVAPPGN